MNPSQKFYEHQLFRNQVARYHTVMTETEFKSLSQCVFSCKFDPKTKMPMTHQFDKDRFTEVNPVEQDNDYLFKLACKTKIDELIKNKSSKQSIINLSTKYQVLSEETSFIGVLKQKNTNQNETKKIQIPTISVKQEQPKSDPYNSYNS